MTDVRLSPLPPAEAMAYFRSKGLAPADARFDYRDVWRGQHAASFVVAKAMQDDVATLFRDAILKAQGEGRSFRDFADELEPQLRAAGWWGRSTMTDPLTGEVRDVQLGSMHRLRTIFDTTMRTAAAAGRWAQIERTRKAFPYLRYRQIDRPTRRLQHKRFDNLVRPVDDPVWARIYPPNGWFCGCWVEQITQGQVDRGEVEVSPPFDLDEVEWENARTGRTEDIPRGVHPGFDVNPGMIWLDMTRRMEGLSGPPNHPELVGLGTQLRLDALRDGRARGAYVAPDGEVRGATEAPAASPEQLPPPSLDTAGLDFIRAVPTERSFSREELLTLTDEGLAGAITVTPGGSVFAVHLRGSPADSLGGLLDQFEVRLASDPVQLALAKLPADERRKVVEHVRLLWLERHERLDYFWDVTGRQNDLFSSSAGLFDTLLVDPPQKSP